MKTQSATQPYAPLRPLRSVNETARLLGVERSMIYRLVRQGALTPVVVGQRKRFREEDLIAYLERDREAATA